MQVWVEKTSSLYHYFRHRQLSHFNEILYDVSKNVKDAVMLNPSDGCRGLLCLRDKAE
jgi:hypothetical protein